MIAVGLKRWSGYIEYLFYNLKDFGFSQLFILELFWVNFVTGVSEASVLTVPSQVYTLCITSPLFMR